MSETKSPQTGSQMGRALTTLEGIVSSLEEGQRASLQQQLKAVRDRYADDKLNLAIIGEYSCGKSTFINALFQREILATNMQPTTAVPTYITWNSPNGQFIIEAFDENDKPFSVMDSKGRKKFKARTGIELPDDPEKLMDALTTDNRLCNILSKVVVQAPVRDKYTGICLIDTPGVNPGTEGTEEHVRRTQEVLRDAADAAIIMFPADRVFTKSFEVFLEENARHLLKHSIFVITKCDMIRTQESLSELRDFVRFHLDAMGVKEPEVHCISAGCALDAYIGDTEVSRKEKDWQARFEESFRGIFESMAARRNNIVHENVSDVIQQATELLMDDLKKKRNVLKQTERELASKSPEKMQEACLELLAWHSDRIRQISNKYEVAGADVVGSAIQATNIEANRRIDWMGSKQALSDYLNNFGNNGTGHLRRKMQGHINMASDEMKAVLEDFRKKLEECYRSFQLDVSAAGLDTLGADGKEAIDTEGIHSDTSGFLTGSSLLEEYSDMVDGIFNSDSLMEGAIMAAVAVIAAPFMIAGALYNTFIPLDKMKTTARERVRTSLEGTREKACESMKVSVAKLKTSYLAALAKLPEMLVEKYSEEFNEAQKFFNVRREATDAQMTQADSQLKQLRRIANNIKKGVY